MFKISGIQVSDDDIAKIEAKFGFEFNDGQKKLLRHWESVDIQACPGSGKTTTLAAKLMLLIGKIPPSFSQGICIITHTNIAVEEIKAKLGDSSKHFFQYPHHFGTIQSFVDKYLAIPYFKNLFKKSPRIIDDFTYHEQICNLYELNVNKTIDFLVDRKNIFLGGLSYNKHNFDISKSVNDKEKYAIPGVTVQISDKYVKRIFNAKEKLLSEGYLKYDEAYALAFKYVREHARVLEAIRTRFPIVFVDEMQDMEEHQSEIISLLFGAESIVQKIGDINQSIFSTNSGTDDIQWKPVTHPDIKLIQSNRLSEHLANLVKHICCVPQEIIGWKNPNPIKPVIFVFDGTTILTVKNEFAKRVIANNLHGKGPVKVIGSRISPSKLNIASYWPEFNRNYRKNDYKNLTMYLFDIQNRANVAQNVKELKQQFLYCFCSYLKLCKVKNPVTNLYFTPFSFIKFLNDSGSIEKIQNMDKKIAEWIIKLRNLQPVTNEVILFSRKILTFFDKKSNDEAETFLTDTAISDSGEEPENRTHTFQVNEQSVDIIFDTIHAVKGETHTATLYVETFTRIFDIGGKVLNFLVADDAGRDKLRKDKACYKKLPHAYVAITRATDFLAIAVHSDRFLENHKNYFEAEESEWEVVYL